MAINDDEFVNKDDVSEVIKQDLLRQGIDPSKMKISFDMTEDMLVFGLAGGFLHNLNYVDDPIFLEAANATLGTHSHGEPVPEEDLICEKIPMTLTGYALLDGKGELIGFSCFASQLTGDTK